MKKRKTKKTMMLPNAYPVACGAGDDGRESGQKFSGDLPVEAKTRHHDVRLGFRFLGFRV